jgi:hypothetical protein
LLLSLLSRLSLLSLFLLQLLLLLELWCRHAKGVHNRVPFTDDMTYVSVKRGD